jgi:hypothetical protein
MVQAFVDPHVVQREAVVDTSETGFHLPQLFTHLRVDVCKPFSI